MPWPNEMLAAWMSDHFSWGASRPAVGAGQLDGGSLAEVELADPAVQRRLAEAVGDLGGADVRRGGEDLGHGQPLGGVGVVDDVARGVLPAALLAVERLVLADDALLERGGHGDRLEGRAGLVGGLDGEVVGLLGALDGVVGVEGRAVGEREDLAVARVEHDDAGADRVPLPRRAG
jgi:hypothetical protein